MDGPDWQDKSPQAVAKACGCKFYLGSDAHGRDGFAGVDKLFGRAIDLRDLQESDKFIPAQC